MTEQKYFVFRFEDVEVREREFTVSRDGETLPANPEPSAFSSSWISKDELLAVWSDCSVSENSLTRSVALPRRILADDSREPRYIATVPTIGYRFLCDVKFVDESTGTPRSSQSFRRFHSLAVLPFANGTGPAEAGVSERRNQRERHKSALSIS